MKNQTFVLQRYEADNGKVFDWKNLEEHMTEDKDGNMIQEHLYSTILFLGVGDDISNYVEVDAPIVEED